MDDSYAIPVGQGGVLIGESTQPSLFNDTDLQLERESRARSGNYLETIATELENLTTAIDDELVSGQIEGMVEELLYIQERYQLVKKSPGSQRPL